MRIFEFVFLLIILLAGSILTSKVDWKQEEIDMLRRVNSRLRENARRRQAKIKKLTAEINRLTYELELKNREVRLANDHVDMLTAQCAVAESQKQQLQQEAGKRMPRIPKASMYVKKKDGSLIATWFSLN